MKFCEIITTIAVAICCCTAFNAAPLLAQQPEGYTTFSDSTRWKRRETYALECIESLRKNNFEAARSRFDFKMKIESKVDVLQKFWQQFMDKCGGELYEIEEIARDEYNYHYWIFPTFKARKDSWQFRIAFNEQDSIAGFFIDKKIPEPKTGKWVVPNYVNTDSVIERSIKLYQGTPSEMVGTLTVPAHGRNFPLIILVHDAGPWDMDATRYSNKPFLDMAWGLANKGVAVFRYPKRTYAHYKTLSKTDIVADINLDILEDAEEALRQSKEYTSIDKNRVFLAAHGLGGYLAPKIAKKDSSIAGLILLAPFGRPFEDAIVSEVEYVLTLDTLNNYKSKKKTLDNLKKQVKKVKSPSLHISTSPEELPLGTPAKYWLDLRGYDPIKTAKSTNKPILILWGERDYRALKLDFSIWKNGLLGSAVATPKYQCYSFPTLNNIFMPGEDKSSPLEYHIPKNVDEQFLKTIVQWTAGVQ